MVKAYDPKELLNKIKAQGLPVLEDGAEKLTRAVFEWLKQSAEVSATPLDDVAVAFYPHIEKMALDQIDKVDGQVGV